MSENAMLSSTQEALGGAIGQKSQRVIDKLRAMPIAFWRGLVIVIAVIWMVRSAATLFWVIFPTPDLPQPKKLAAPIQAQSSAGAKSVSFDSLAKLKDVFGTSAPIVATKPVEKPADEVDVDVATTRLRLKLHGVFASSDPKQGSAIIADGNKQALYSVGDEVEGNRGVKLARVMEKRVILDNKGRFESLWLFSEEDFKAASRKTAQKATPQRAAPKVADRPERNETRATARPDQIPKNIGDVVRFSVHREGGKMVGYRIRPGRDRELFNQVGLKANDIVTSVNGIEVNDPKQIRSVYKSMKTATEAQLTVLRGGETHSITISLDSGA